MKKISMLSVALLLLVNVGYASTEGSSTPAEAPAAAPAEVTPTVADDAEKAEETSVLADADKKEETAPVAEPTVTAEVKAEIKAKKCSKKKNSGTKGTKEMTDATANLNEGDLSVSEVSSMPEEKKDYVKTDATDKKEEESK